MIREAIDRVLELAGVQTKTIEGVEFSNETLTLVVPPGRSSITVHTLNGLTELIAEQVDGIGGEAGAIFLLVESPLVIKMLSLNSDKWGRRTQFASAHAEPCPFKFGDFMSPEQFIIGLQATFVPSIGDIDYVLRLTSSLSAEAVATADDDGVSQRVATRKGVVLKESENVKSRVKLAPYRTFREVDQPASEFVLRLRTEREGSPPVVGLFEADGGKWKIDAVAAVAAFLSRNTTDIAVVS